MGTITIHGVDKAVDERVREIAHRKKTSINRTAQALLRQALGLDSSAVDHRADFQDLVGRWSQADLDEFKAVTESCSKIDTEDWK